MPNIFRRKKHERRSKRYHSDEISYYRSTPNLGSIDAPEEVFHNNADSNIESLIPAHRKTSSGSFNQHERPKSEELASQASSNSLPRQNLLDQPLPSRNVRTAPPTPEVESKAFPRHAESTSQLEMATPSTSIATTTASTPSPSSTPSVTTSGISSKKPKESTILKNSEAANPSQKSPHKEVSPKITKSRNEKFHKLFKNIPRDEVLLNTYSCAYFGDILLQGFLYISPNWFCFYSKILAHQKFIQIPVCDIISISREKTAFIIPNAIKVKTSKLEKYVFGSLISRDNTFKLMLSIWKKARPEYVASNGVPPEDLDGSDGLTVSYDGGNSGTENNNVMKPTIELTPNTSFDTSGTEDSNCNECLECGNVSNGRHRDCGEAARRIEDSSRFSNRNHEPYKSKHKSKNVTQCYKCPETFSTTGQLVTNILNMPRTSLLLGVCAILAVFLVMSAVIMAYKIMTLQARIESPHTADGKNSAHDSFSTREWLLRDKYYLNNQYHVATVEKFHAVLQANIQLLGEVHESLKNLQSSSLVRSNTCISSDPVVGSVPES